MVFTVVLKLNMVFNKYIVASALVASMRSNLTKRLGRSSDRKCLVCKVCRIGSILQNFNIPSTSFSHLARMELREDEAHEFEVVKLPITETQEDISAAVVEPPKSPLRSKRRPID